MFKIEYEIKLNENGRPCIELSEDYEDKEQDKFFALEITRYFLQSVYSRRSSEFDQNTATHIDNTINLLGQIGDEMAQILWKNMKVAGDFDLITDKKYHFKVNSYNDLNKIPQFTVNHNKLYLKQNNLKVLVEDENVIYILNDDVWKEL